DRRVGCRRIRAQRVRRTPRGRLPPAEERQLVHPARGSSRRSPGTDAAAQMTTVFHEVGRYAIHRELGRGGMATVFLATDTDLHVDVALKQVPVGSDREAREILEAEEWGAQLQACFSQMFDCVPKVYRSWKEGDY